MCAQNDVVLVLPIFSDKLSPVTQNGIFSDTQICHRIKTPVTENYLHLVLKIPIVSVTNLGFLVTDGSYSVTNHP